MKASRCSSYAPPLLHGNTAWRLGARGDDANVVAEHATSCTLRIRSLRVRLAGRDDLTVRGLRPPPPPVRRFIHLNVIDVRFHADSFGWGVGRRRRGMAVGFPPPLGDLRDERYTVVLGERKDSGSTTVTGAAVSAGAAAGSRGWES